MGYVEPALRFAHRLDKLRQGDLEAGAVARKMSAILEMRKRLPPGAAEVR